MDSPVKKSSVPESARSKSKKRRKKASGIDSRLYLLVPLLILGVLAILSSNWRVQRDRAMLASSAATATVRMQAQLAVEATEAAMFAEATATEEARQAALAAIPTATATALPTATSEPTEVPVAAPTEAPTATLEPTATATAVPEPTATTVPTMVPTPEPFSAEISTRYNLLTIRRGPDTNYSRLGAAVAGEPFTAIGQDATGNWIQICCVDGENGWMASEFVSSDVALDELPIVSAPDATVNNRAESVPLYAGPFYNFDLIETLPLNSTLVVTGRNPNGQWYEVCCSEGGESGWVYSGSVLIDGSDELLPVIADDE